MLLKSSLFVLFILAIATANIYIHVAIACILLCLEILYNRDNIKRDIGKIKILAFLYMFTLLVQIFYTQEGRVLFELLGLYVTYEGVMRVALSFMKIINLLMISWIVLGKNLMVDMLGEYQVVIDSVISLIPSALTLVRKRMKLKSFIKYILKELD